MEQVLVLTAGKLSLNKALAWTDLWSFDSALDFSLQSLLREAFEMVVQENGWANLGPMGKALQQLDPGFDPRSFGQRQLSSLIKSLPDFEVRRDEEDASAGIWVRLKE